MQTWVSRRCVYLQGKEERTASFQEVRLGWLRREAQEDAGVRADRARAAVGRARHAGAAAAD